MAALILFGGFFFFMFIRVPVAFALALACLPILAIEPRLDTMSLMQETFNAYNSFILLAVPFFLLTANLMNIGGTTDRLLKLSRTLVGHWPGGLAQINVVLSMFFAGISGSSTADAASQSKIFIEAQTKEGYDLSFSVAITAVSAVLAVIVPPSILMIVWGGILTVSIGALFLAGIFFSFDTRGFRALLRHFLLKVGAHDPKQVHRLGLAGRNRLVLARFSGLGCFCGFFRCSLLRLRRRSRRLRFGLGNRNGPACAS